MPDRVVRRLLAVPLVGKLAGASVLVLLAGVGVVGMAVRAGAPTGPLGFLVAVVLLLALLVDLLLVDLALRPLRDLDRTAERVSAGDLAARVPASPLADRDVARIGETFNRVLDGLVADRARLRLLVSEVIRTGDAERARIARELHDGTAQTLAALKLEVSVLVRRHVADPELAERLTTIAALAADALEETRAISHVVHPRVLDDLGLPAALQWLGRQVAAHDGVEVTVDVAPVTLAPEEAAVLYRVAQEALRNAARHAGGAHVRATLAARDGGAELAIADDGRGFDLADAARRRPGMGLFTMRERVGLVDGRLTIESTPGAGTRVVAWVPHHAPAPEAAGEAPREASLETTDAAS